MSKARIISPEQILDLLGIQYLQKSGRLAFCCPIHDDRDPSAGFYQDTELAHCFSCNYTLPPAAFYAKVKRELEGQPWKDSMRELNRIFGDFEPRTARCDRHLLNTTRARAERELTTARNLSRKDHACLAEMADRILLAYERGQIDVEALDKVLKIWYNRVREAKNAGSYQNRNAEIGPDAGIEEGLGDLSEPGSPVNRRAMAEDGADGSIDLA